MHGMICFRVSLRAVPKQRRKTAERNHKGGFDMLMKIGGLARAIAIVLAIVAGFVALNMMNVPLVLVVLGPVAGLAMPEVRVIVTAVMLIALPIVGTALTHISTISAHLNSVALNLQTS